MNLAKRVWLILQEKGTELRLNGCFSAADWDSYVLSIGCEPVRGESETNFGGYEEGDNIFVRDENHVAYHVALASIAMPCRPVRYLKMDRETAMKIATLGLP
jgi:hypothetical protein